MKVPRDVDANELMTLLKRHGYSVMRQSGSHIRLSKIIDNKEHAITVPNHKPIKIGVLQNIVKDVCSANRLEVNAFYQQL